MILTPEQIKDHRKRHGQTQGDLALAANVSIDLVKKWERYGIADNQIKKALVIVGMVSHLELKTEESVG
jgi:DNA-binding transcriptional regulator YiaG